MTIPISPNQVIRSSEIKGLAGISNLSEYVSLTTSYQVLAAAPASGVIKRVNTVRLRNTDPTDTADFYLKLVKSSVDYVPIPFSLAPGEEFLLRFPWLLDSNCTLQVKTGTACDGQATASSVTWAGGMEVLNFTGDTFADLVTVPTGKQYELLAMLLVNTDATKQDVSLQVVDGSAAVQCSDKKSLSSSAVYFQLLDMAIGAGWKLQVKHGAALKTGSVVVSYLEVPA